MKKVRGFTLIELLVVIAIIGILAAMLFPVFARARESARKTQCLANVKNVATAINMYLVDYDRLFPSVTDRAAADYFNQRPGGKEGDPIEWPEVCNHAAHANPYLRPAVILEEYVKNRDVWRCPSARYMDGAQFIVSVGRDGNWLNNYLDADAAGVQWGINGDYNFGPCSPAFPSGWGGEITDSFVQQTLATIVDGTSAGGKGVFVQGVGTSSSLTGLNPASVNDTASYVAVGDAGTNVSLWAAVYLAFPDLCKVTLCGWDNTAGACCTADWANCADSRNCGLDGGQRDKFFSDSTMRKNYTRHLGGSNVGFLDGHAKWYPADTILFQSCPYPDHIFEGGLSNCCWPGSPCQ